MTDDNNSEELESKFGVKTNIIIVFSLLILAIFFAILVVKYNNNLPEGQLISEELENFQEYNISCLKNNVIFFGADWCGHCRKQKEILGKEITEAIYVDCSDSLLCKEFKIEALPTIVFLNTDIRVLGTQKLDFILNQSNCTN